MTSGISDWGKRAAQWVVWSPWRILMVAGGLVLLWLMSLTFTAADSPSTPTPAPTVAVGPTLPDGWETWPSTTAK